MQLGLLLILLRRVSEVGLRCYKIQKMFSLKDWAQKFFEKFQRKSFMVQQRPPFWFDRNLQLLQPYVRVGTSIFLTSSRRVAFVGSKMISREIGMHQRNLELTAESWVCLVVHKLSVKPNGSQRKNVGLDGLQEKVWRWGWFHVCTIKRTCQPSRVRTLVVERSFWR